MDVSQGIGTTASFAEAVGVWVSQGLGYAPDGSYIPWLDF